MCDDKNCHEEIPAITDLFQTPVDRSVMKTVAAESEVKKNRNLEKKKLRMRNKFNDLILRHNCTRCH